MAEYFASASDAGVLSRFSKENTDVADLVIKTLDSETAISATAEAPFRFGSVWSFPEAGSPAEFELYASVITSDDPKWVACGVGLFENTTNYLFGMAYASIHGLLAELVDNVRTNLLYPRFVLDQQIRKWVIRVRVFGLGTAKAVKIKVWQGAEPSAWSAEGNYDQNNSSGLVGISIPATDQGIVSYGIGTDGDSAPTSPVATGPEAPINPSVTDLLATSARLNWEQG